MVWLLEILLSIQHKFPLRSIRCSEKDVPEWKKVCHPKIDPWGQGSNWEQYCHDLGSISLEGEKQIGIGIRRQEKRKRMALYLQLF